MNELTVYWGILIGLLVFATISAVSLFWITAPYGRFATKSWGPMISSQYGWLVMESPASLAMIVWFCLGEHRDNPVDWIFLILWQCHYLYRSFVFPFRRRGGKKPMPISVVAMGMTFNLINTYLIGRWLFTLAPAQPLSWLLDPRFNVGVVMYFAGMALNRQSDQILRQLRKPGETGYKIPFGGPYRWVSAPNYLGELLEWLGFALATWCLGGLAFALFTAANLIPRALSIHRWYRQEFNEYPAERKAIFPGLLYSTAAIQGIRAWRPAGRRSVRGFRPALGRTPAGRSRHSRSIQ